MTLKNSLLLIAGLFFSLLISSCDDTGGIFGKKTVYNISIDSAPLITSTAPKTAIVDNQYAYAITVAGMPMPTLSVSGLPGWLNYNTETMTISGTPTADDIGTTGTIIIRASNGILPEAVRTYAITVSGASVAPNITSTAITTAIIGSQYSYNVTVSGNPTPTVNVSGLPGWLSYNSGTQTISGTPTAGDIGTTGTITITASNGILPDMVQTFSITVDDWALYDQYVVIDLQSPYTVTNLSSVPSDLLTNDAYKTTKLVLKRISAGTFQMGDQTGAGWIAELPVHPVTITKDFYIGVFEVTQRQWFEVMGNWPSNFSISPDKRPVEQVSWYDIKDNSGFMDSLSALIGEPFDLPTEAEWEYCCKAGTSTNFSYGDIVDGAYMWYDINSGSQTKEVGTRLPNPWGLYDIHGNVREWCLDWYSDSSENPPSYYQTCNDLGTVYNPIGPATGSSRVRRGGSFYNNEDNCRSSYRASSVPDGWSTRIGFRIVAVRRAPVITSSAITAASVDMAYSYNITFAGNPTPTVNVSGLPGWLSYNSGTQTISGTPTAGDIGTTGTITITASNGISPDAVQTFEITVDGLIIYVNQAATGSNNGTSWADAYADLQDALAVATSGDEIWVAEGTYKPTAGTDRTVSFIVPQGIKVYGGFDGSESLLSQRNVMQNITTLSGDIGALGDIADNTYHIMKVTGNEVVVDGFEFILGNASDTGEYSDGAAIYATGDYFTINKCTFKNNLIIDSGSVFLLSSDNSVISSCHFIDNTAAFGAGIYNSNSSPHISNCIFVRNHASGKGGAMENFNGSSPTIVNCTFYGNSAQYGGAISNYNNCSPSIVNSILWANTASVSGIHLRNEISSTPVLSYCCVSGGYAGTGNISSEPIFVDSTNDDYRLRVNSPCKDSGTAVGSPILDIEGNIRDLNPDMGAYEYTTTNRPACIWRVDHSATGTNNGTSWTNAFASLQSALSVALSGDEIWVAAGTYTPTTANGDRYISFVIPNGVKLYGGFSGNELSLSGRNIKSSHTILSGDLNNNDGVSWPPLQSLINDNSFHVVRPRSDSVIDGFIIERGNANDTSTTNWYERNGAGVFGYQAHYVLKNCIIRFNSAEENGAGIIVCYYSAIIENCLIYRNRSYGSYNTYGKGAGFFCGFGATVVVRNCTFVNNVAEQFGGAICIINSDFTGQNIIMYDNMAGAVRDQYYINSSTVSFSYSCSEETLSGIGNINSNPLFVDAANNDYRLSIGSPCIDSGSGTDAPEYDIEGNPRVDVSGVINTGTGTPPYVDIGAYEFQE